MHPTIISFFGITIRTYGLFVAIAVLVGFKYVLRNSIKRNIDADFISNLTFGLLLFGFLGARMLYVVLNFEYYKNDLLSIVKIWEGGLVLYGGVLFGLIFSFIYIKINKKNFLEVSDLYAPAIFLGLSIGRLGCFFAGCCYGKETQSFLGVIFRNPESLAPIGVKIFPTQLFESLYSVLIFFILNNFFVKKKFKERLLFFGLILYSIFRFFNEFLRGDYRGEPILGFSPSQFISIVLIILNFIIIVYITNRAKRIAKS